MTRLDVLHQYLQMRRSTYHVGERDRQVNDALDKVLELERAVRQLRKTEQLPASAGVPYVSVEESRRRVDWLLKELAA